MSQTHIRARYARCANSASPSTSPWRYIAALWGAFHYGVSRSWLERSRLECLISFVRNGIGQCPDIGTLRTVIRSVIAGPQAR